MAAYAFWNWEKTFRLLAPLGKAPRVTAEIDFADPVADIALLGEPGGFPA